MSSYELRTRSSFDKLRVSGEGPFVLSFSKHVPALCPRMPERPSTGSARTGDEVYPSLVPFVSSLVPFVVSLSNHALRRDPHPDLPRKGGGVEASAPPPVSPRPRFVGEGLGVTVQCLPPALNATYTRHTERGTAARLSMPGVLLPPTSRSRSGWRAAIPVGRVTWSFRPDKKSSASTSSSTSSRLGRPRRRWTR